MHISWVDIRFVLLRQYSMAVLPANRAGWRIEDGRSRMALPGHSRSSILYHLSSKRGCLFEAGEEIGEGFGDALGTGNGHARDLQAGESESHRHTMVVVGVDLGRPAPAGSDCHAVG